MKNKKTKSTVLTAVIALSLGAACALGAAGCNKKSDGDKKGGNFPETAPTVEVTEEQWKTATGKWRGWEDDGHLTPCKVSVSSVRKLNIIDISDYPHYDNYSDYKKTERTGTAYYFGTSLYLDVEIKSYRKVTDVNYDVIENRSAYMTVVDDTVYVAMKRTVSPDSAHESTDGWAVDSISYEGVPEEFRHSAEEYTEARFRDAFIYDEFFGLGAIPAAYYGYANYSLTDGSYNFTYINEYSHSDNGEYKDSYTDSYKFDGNCNVTYFSHSYNDYTYNEYYNDRLFNYSGERKMAITDFNNVNDSVVPAEAKKAIEDYKANR